MLEIYAATKEKYRDSFTLRVSLKVNCMVW